jgi:sugar phosphate isomerase/epimerase
LKRRDFIQASVIGPVILSSALQLKKSTKMKVIIFNTNWGFEGSVFDFCKKTKEAGYDGIEIWLPEKKALKEFYEAVQKYELQFGFLIGGSSSSVTDHTIEFEKALVAACDSIVQKPLYINCHSGKDFFLFSENEKMIALGIEQEIKSGIEILHETHRGRMCYTAPITKLFLEKYKEMQVTLDISHWTNVHESMLDDQKETIDYVLSKTGHIHARIGHEESPQVNDPRAPEWKSHVEKHFTWWDKVVTHREASGKKYVSFLTEFGPATYMPTLPYTCQPVANQWDINVFMKNQIRERYSL